MTEASMPATDSDMPRRGDGARDPGRADRWLIFGVAVFCTAVGMMAWGAVFPLLPLWIDDLGITRAQGGMLFSLYFLPGIVLALPGGWAFDRLPVRRVFGLCWICIAIGTVIMAQATSYWWLCLGRLVFAVGMNVHQIGAPKLVAAWFEGRPEFGLAMGLYTWGYTIGIVSSFSGLGWIGQHAGWRTAMMMLAGLTIVGMAAMTAAAREPGSAALADRSRTPAPRFLLPREAAIWLLALIWLFYNASVDSYKTFTPDYLVRRGYGLAEASSTASAYLWIGFLMKPLCAVWLTSRTAPWFAAAGALLAALTLLLVPHLWVPRAVIAFGLGASIGFAIPAITALPAVLLGSERAGQGYGLCQFFYSLCFLAPPLVGWAIDATADHTWAYTIMSAYAGTAVLAAVALGFSPGTSAAPLARTSRA